MGREHCNLERKLLIQGIKMKLRFS